MDSRKTIVGFFLFGGGKRFRVRNALCSIGLWILFFPVVVLGQVHVPNVQVYTGVTAARVLLNPNLPVLEEREQDVDAATLLSAEPCPAPFEAVWVGGGDLSQNNSAPVLPLPPHWGSSMNVSVSTTDPAGGLLEHRWSDNNQMLGNVWNFSMVARGNSNPFMIHLGDSKTAKTELHATAGTNKRGGTAAMDEFPPRVEFSNSSPVATAIMGRDMIPSVRFKFSNSVFLNESIGTSHHVVSINPAPKVAFELKYRLIDVSTTKGDDYKIPSGTLTIPAGETEATIFVEIIDDKEHEYPDPEIFYVSLEDGSGYTVVDSRLRTVSIWDNDDPEVHFALATDRVSEDAGTHGVEVLMSSAPATALTLSYTLAGTADEGSDYTIASSGSVVVPAKAISVDIPVAIIDDQLDEPHETVILTLAPGTDYTLGSPNKHTLTIEDDDEPEVRFVLETDRVSEDAGTHNVEVTISLEPVSGFTLSYMLGGTADEGSDYTIASSGSVLVPAKATSVEIPVLIVDDTEHEPDETVILRLASAGTEYEVVSPSEHTLTIEDNDEPDVHFALATDRVSEDVGTHGVEVIMSSAPAIALTLNYTLGGTADEDSDYTIASSGSVVVPAKAISVDIPVAIIDDQLDELDETVILMLTPGTEYEVGSPSEHTLTIEDDDEPEVHFALATDRVSEDAGTHGVEVLMSSAPAIALTLNYTLGGTADEGSDYTIVSPGSVVVPAKAMSVDIPVAIINDQLDELDETVILTLVRGTDYTLGSPSKHTLTIEDNDDPAVHFVLATDRVHEDVGTHNVEVTISPEPVSGFTLSYMLGGTADEGSDYTIASSGSVLVPAKAISVDIPVAIIDDQLDEPHETVILTLEPAPDYKLVNPRRHTLTIVGDGDPVRLSADPNPVEEGGEVTVTAMLLDARDMDRTIPLIVTSGSADAEDYTAPPPAQVVINAGETSGTYEMSTTMDEIDENDETFTVVLGDLPSGLVRGDSSSVLVTILDDDEAGIDAPPLVDVMEGSENSFAIALTSKPLAAVEVELSWLPGTDLTVEPVRLEFTPETWRERHPVTLRARRDEDLEDDEVLVMLTASGSTEYTDVSETVLVAIMDITEAGIAVEPEIEITEGSTKPLAVRLLAQPSEQVEVMVTGH
ncbi:MAG: hypothetical protein F4Z62_08220, partial [Rhodothermaceae bacterium]|nr:hypothetical protein [Rhodothermaceae bacterium]